MPPDAPRWLDRAALARHVGLSEAALRRRLKDGTIPAPSYHLGPRCPRWDRAAVDALFTLAAPSMDARSAISRLAQEIAGR